MDLDLGQWGSLAAGGAVLATVFGVIVRGWSSFKAFCLSLTSIVIVRVNFEDSTTPKAVLSYLLKNYKRSQLADRTLGGKHQIFRSGKYGHVPYEAFGGKRMIFWRGWIPFLFNVEEPKVEEKKSSVIYWGAKPKDDCKQSLVFIRGTINVDNIIRESSKERNQLYWSETAEVQRRFFIKKLPNPEEAPNSDRRLSAGTDLAWYNEGTFKLLANSVNELGHCHIGNGKAMDNLYFPDNIKKIFRTIELWRNNRAWFEARHISWKSGAVLYGPPGTGKTAAIRCMGEDLDMPIFVYALGEMQNIDLERSWQAMQAHTPCFAVFEDFDNVFHGRENVYGRANVAELVEAAGITATKQFDNSSSTNRGLLSFDCLLNCIDGLDKSSGIFTIITTNHIEKLDPALGQPKKNADGSISFVSTRPGRIDHAVELSYMEKGDKVRLAKRIFFDNDEGFQRMLELIGDAPETPAQFQLRCSQVALEYLWKQLHQPSVTVDKIYTGHSVLTGV